MAAFSAFDILFVSVRGMSISQLLVVLGAMFTRFGLWKQGQKTVEGGKDLGNIVGKVLLPIFVFMEFAKPESRDKLKTVFASAEGPLLVGLSAGLMIAYLMIGFVMTKVMAPFCPGMKRAGNVVNISVAFGNATALPVMLIGTILFMFAKEDQVFLYLCVMVYGTINRALMYTAGSAICCGAAKPSLLLNEVNVASVLGLFVAFSQDIIGTDLMVYLHNPNNWLDFVGTGKALGIMANPLLQMVSGASLAKGSGDKKEENLDRMSIMASCFVRLALCPVVCYMALIATGVTSSTSNSMKVLGFVMLMESCMPAASQLSLIAMDSEKDKPGSLASMSTLLFWHSVLCPVGCTVVIAFALNEFSTA